MNKWEIKYEIKQLSFENEFIIDSIVFYKENERAFTTFEVETLSEEHAIKKAVKI